MNRRIIMLIVIVVILLLVASSMFIGWISTSFKKKESWGYAYSSGWQTGIAVVDKETALQAFVIYYSRTENSFIVDTSKKITVDDIYFGVIKNVNTQGFDNLIPELSVWKLNNSILYNKAVDGNGTIYTGGILPYSYASEVGRVT